jgi:hypothetical protein
MEKRRKVGLGLRTRNAVVRKSEHAVKVLTELYRHDMERDRDVEDLFTFYSQVEREANPEGKPYFYMVTLTPPSDNGLANDTDHPMAESSADMDDQMQTDQQHSVFTDDEQQHSGHFSGTGIPELWAIVSQPHRRIIYLATSDHVEQGWYKVLSQVGLTLGRNVVQNDGPTGWAASLQPWQVLFLAENPKPKRAPILAQFMTLLLYWGVTPEGLLDFFQLRRDAPDTKKNDEYGYREMLRALIRNHMTETNPVDRWVINVPTDSSALSISALNVLPVIPSDDILMPLYGYQKEGGGGFHMDATIHPIQEINAWMRANRIRSDDARKKFLRVPSKVLPHGLSPFSQLPAQLVHTQIGKHLDAHDIAAMQLTASKYNGQMLHDNVTLTRIPDVFRLIFHPEQKWDGNDVARVARRLSQASELTISGTAVIWIPLDNEDVVDAQEDSDDARKWKLVPITQSAADLLVAAFEYVKNNGVSHRVKLLELNFNASVPLDQHSGLSVIGKVFAAAILAFAHTSTLQFNSDTSWGHEEPDLDLSFVSALHNNESITSLMLTGNIASKSHVRILDIFSQRRKPLFAFTVVAFSPFEHHWQPLPEEYNKQLSILIAKHSGSLQEISLHLGLSGEGKTEGKIDEALLMCHNLQGLDLSSACAPWPTIEELIRNNAASLKILCFDLVKADGGSLNHRRDLMSIAEAVGKCRNLEELRILDDFAWSQIGGVASIEDAFVNAVLSIPRLAICAMMTDHVMRVRNMVKLLNHASKQMGNVTYHLQSYPVLVTLRAQLHASNEIIGRHKVADITPDYSLQRPYLVKMFSDVMGSAQ